MSMAKNAKKTPRIGEISMSDERLSRMETKLDKLSKAVAEMARMEERLLLMKKLATRQRNLIKYPLKLKTS